MKNFLTRIIKFIRNFIKIRKQRKYNKKFKSQPMSSSKLILPNSTVINVDDGTSVLDVDLLDDNISEKDKKKVRQYTKKLVTALTIMACTWISISYALATYSTIVLCDTDPLLSLSEKVCEVIIGVVISYALKSYFESFSQAKHELDVMKYKQMSTDDSEEESVG